MWRQTKLIAVNTNLVKTQKLELQTLRWVFFLPLLHTSLLCCLSVFSFVFSAFSIYLIYNFILHIEKKFRLADLTFEDCNYSLPRNLASTTKFYCLIYERSELLILSDSLTLSDLLQTLTESGDLIMDQQVINISNTPP